MLSRVRSAVGRSVGVRGLGSLSGLQSGLEARVCAVLGGQWGDEGKGKLADVLAANYDIVARFNGGANAGHTVIAEGRKFAFHLLPCGLIYPHTTNVLGNGTVVNVDDLFEELAQLDGTGIDWEGRLFLGDRAHLLFGFHKEADGANEERLRKGGATAIGTTKKGIGPAYTSRAARSGVRVGHLKDFDSFAKRYRDLLAEVSRWHALSPYDGEEELERLHSRLPLLQSMVLDSSWFLNDALANGKRIITEGANAAMLDIDFGTYPFVTSSNTTAGGIATGLGIPPDRVDCVLGVLKAYTTRVGGGPFPTELTDERGGGERRLNDDETDIGLHMQEVGAEIGVTTGRKRRCGWFDGVVAQYSHMLNGYQSVNLTKLDVLDDLDEVKIATAYRIDGQRLPPGSMPSTLEELAKVEVEYESLPGWKTSIADCKTYQDLPPNARAYVEKIEQVANVPVSWIGVGPGREHMVRKGF